MQSTKIALGYLRHITAGKHTFFMPIGISYIASYVLSRMEAGSVEIRLYDNPDGIIKDIADWGPQIVGLSNYCWNSELSLAVLRYAKRMDPAVVCIAGGPNFPVESAECHAYLSKRPEIDFYVYFEGELSFTQLVKKIQGGAEISHLKSEPQMGIMSIHPKDKNLVFGGPMPRLTNLDEIPSPYLNGLLDQWFNGYYAPSIETARGCPFSCGYCYTGQSYYNRITTFSVQRIKDELTYIARRMRKYPNILLSICDNDFGMTERDEQIAVHIGKLQDEFGWPNAFDITTGKRNYDRILRISAILKNKMYIACSLQSLNPGTLKIIKRKNLPLDEYREINTEIERRGMNSVTEIIVPMPKETKNSFFEGSARIINILNPKLFVPHTTMLLPGTYLASKECREKYQMQTKFRILPRQFGEYFGEKCFEIEEVCIATNTMPFNDYLEIRGFLLISSFFSSELFDVVHRHLKELKVDAYDYFRHLWKLIKSGKGVLSETYRRYMKEVGEELWDSRNAIYDYFTKEKNYKKLLDGTLGDNLIRKYKAELFLENCIASIELAYASIEAIAGNILSEKIKESMSSAKSWMIATRNIGSVFKDKRYIDTDETLHLPYDVNAWYLDGANCDPLIAYNTSADYQIFCDADNLKKIFDEMKTLYGGDFIFQAGKMLTHSSINNFYRKCEPFNHEV